MKLAMMFVVSLFLSFLALAQEAPITQDKPVVAQAPAVAQQCSISEEISLTVSGDGCFELRCTPKPPKKGSAQVAKTQVVSYRRIAACGGGTVMEWTSTSQSKKSSKQSVLRVTSIGGITGVAVPRAEFTKSESLPNAEPEAETQNVQLKELQGRFLLALMARLADLSHHALSVESPLRVDPVLAQDVVTLFASSQRYFYSVVKAKNEKKAKEPAAVEPIREDMPRVVPADPGDKPEKGM